jgi:hypothetical protein
MALPALADKFLVKGRGLGLMFPLLIKKRPHQPALATQLHSSKRGTIIVPVSHYVCSAICSIFVVTVRQALAGKGRGQGQKAAALTTIADPMSQGSVPGLELI